MRRSLVSRMLLPAYTLWQRELVRFLRQRGRVFSAILQPGVFWLLFGFGFHRSFDLGGGADGGQQTFLEYLFPGTVVMILLFAAIFSTISVIRDRQEGFLQSVLVAPVSRSGIVLGKMAGGATLAFVQGLIFLLLAPVLGIIPMTIPAFLTSVVIVALVALALTGVGMIVAWPMDSTQAFHGIMMLVLMPMWLLSGAFFPLSGVPDWLGWVMRLNPLTYGVSALRWAMYGQVDSRHQLPDWGVSVGVTVAFVVASFAMTLWVVHRRAKRDPK